MTAPSSTLAGWQARPFTGAGSTYDVYAKSPSGGGPGVVLSPEIPGMTPEVLALADHLVDAGFSQDKVVSAQRFAAYADTFGDSIELIVLDSAAGNPDGYKSSAHSVLTGEVRENPPNSAYAAREKVVAFLRSSLGA